MAIRSYGIIEDTDKGVLVMGTKSSDFLEGFLVFFGGAVEVDREELAKDAFLRELDEESHKRVSCPSDDVRRFMKLLVTEPRAAELVFFRCTQPTYTTGEIPFGREIGSVVAVSLDKVLDKLPDDPNAVTSADVANALVELYGGGADIRTYRTSGIMRALREYLVKYCYDRSTVEGSEV